MEGSLELETKEVARLEALGAATPGSAAFAALAESHRRAGRAEQAERVARQGLEARPEDVSGRVALGLALLDQERLAEARSELELALAALPEQVLAAAALERIEAREPRAPWIPPPPAAVALGDVIDDGTLDRAFAAAELETDQLVDAHHVAERAVAAAEAELDLADEVVPGPESPFATRTVADLLERQGHSEQAHHVLRAVSERERATSAPAPAASSLPEARQVLGILEQWLDNIRRGVA